MRKRKQVKEKKYILHKIDEYLKKTMNSPVRYKCTYKIIETDRQKS